MFTIISLTIFLKGKWWNKRLFKAIYNPLNWNEFSWLSNCLGNYSLLFEKLLVYIKYIFDNKWRYISMYMQYRPFSNHQGLHYGNNARKYNSLKVMKINMVNDGV